ncbi:MAG: hypothetical protein Q4F57_00705 [Weeksellaceae bacterium]|nr:hypothetical protein [Weeksellaceae bacterium]
MGRIFLFGNQAFDLGNIKYIDTKPFNGSDGGCYVNIHLLKGNEYLYNPEEETMELIQPIIRKGFGEDRHAWSFIEAISEEWGKFLEGREFDLD